MDGYHLRGARPAVVVPRRPGAKQTHDLPAVVLGDEVHRSRPRLAQQPLPKAEDPAGRKITGILQRPLGDRRAGRATIPQRQALRSPEGDFGDTAGTTPSRRLQNESRSFIAR